MRKIVLTINLTKLNKSLRMLFVFLIIFIWLFSGWPQIGHEPSMPPKLQKAKAAPITQNIIVAWPYASSSIPIGSGWYRDTTLDTYFLKSIPDAVTSPGTTGGAANHTHTASNDGHTQTASHSHTSNGNTPGASGTGTTKSGPASNADGHQHSIPDSDSVIANAIASGGTTIDAASNNPPYREVIWIYSAGGATEIPHGAIAFFSSADDIPGGWVATSTGLFYRGAPAATDPNYSTQGADTHTHTNDHTHTQTAIAHTSANTGEASADSGTEGVSGSDISVSTHVHSVTWGDTSWTTGSASANVQNENTLPPYLGLVAAQNNTGSAATPLKVIAIWRQSLPPPTDWVLCGSGQTCNIDIFGRFVMATTTANLLNTGGATSHGHSVSGSHFHTSNHTHTFSFGTPSLVIKKSAPPSPTVSSGSHTHADTTSAPGGANTDPTTITVDTSATETRPPYYEVAFIQYQPEAGYLYFSVDSGTETFPNLTPGNLVATTSILTVRTNNSTGFNITTQRNDADTTMDLDTDALVNITDKTTWSAGANCSTPGNATASTTEPQTLQFRVRQTGTDASNYCSAWWGSDDTTANALFAGFPSGAQQIIYRSSSATATTTSYVLYNLDTPITQKMGIYSGGITYTATANP